MFYCVEAWVTSPDEPFVTHYLGQIEVFQRHMTTAAFKIAGGVEASSSVTRPLKQHPIPSAFVTKITKAFLDALYAILDGLVLLASDESPIVRGKRPDVSTALQMGLNPLELLDLIDSVCQFSPDQIV